MWEGLRCDHVTACPTVNCLLVGVFVPLNIKGRDFGMFLVYTGALFVLMSLGGWVLLYSGNIDSLASSKELGHIGTTVGRLARTLSCKMHIHRPQGTLGLWLIIKAGFPSTHWWVDASLGSIIFPHIEPHQ